MTSCFVYKVMVLNFHERINTQLIYRFELAQVVARRITKPQRIFLGSNLTGCSFFYSVLIYLFLFIFFFWGGGGLNSYSRIFTKYTVVCVVANVLYMCPIHVKAIKKNKKKTKLKKEKKK